jgi:hypothetical protein
MSLRTAALVVLVSMAWAAPAGADAGGGARPPAHEELYAEEPTIELVTMGVGALIWERHGHIALCLRYRSNPGRDVCYNYGIADFHKPISMAWGFFRGTKSFWVGKMRADHMLANYEYADRTIWYQPLPLTLEQKRQVIEKLESDIRPENRYYSYDHFLDNCTTRVRDVIDDAAGGVLRAMADQQPAGDETFRDLAREGFFGMRGPLLITDLAMGRSTDRIPTYWERMFLPDYLREAVQKHWGIEPYVAYQRKGAPPLEDGPSGRVLLALVLLVLTAPAWATRLLGRFQRAGLAIAVVPYVVLGTVLWGLALISPLDYVRWNETCLILLPADILLIAFLSPARRRRYAQLRVGMLALLAVLNIASVIKAPLLAPILWPLVPCLVVGFWPARRAASSSSSSASASSDSASDAPASDADSSGKLSRSVNGGRSPKGGKSSKSAAAAKRR